MAVRQKGALASLHCVTMLMVLVLNILDSMSLGETAVTLDSGTENFRALCRRLSFHETSTNQNSTRATFFYK